MSSTSYEEIGTVWEFWALGFFAFVITVQFSAGQPLSENPLVWAFGFIMLFPMMFMQVITSAIPLLAPLTIVGMVLVLFQYYRQQLGEAGFFTLIGCVVVVLTSV